MTQLTVAGEPPAAPVAQEPPVAQSASVGGQGVRFFLIGSTGTGLQLGLYAAGAVLLGAQVASIASWLVSTLTTNAAHRAFTFGVRGADRNRADQIAAFVTCLVGLLITSVVLAELPDATGLAGVVAILAVNTVVGAGRFVGMRWWLGESGRRLAQHATGLAHSAAGALTHRDVSGLNH